MSFLGFSAIGAAALFSLIVPLVVLYFLKLKRPRLEVPSLMLWRSVLQDNRVNSPFQRFKRNFLLVLQLLLLILLVLAAMQPYWRTDPHNTHRLPIILDTSASMSALAAAGDTSRLEAAKQIARDLIRDLDGHQQIALIACNITARRVVPFTSNKRLLLDALDTITVEHVGSDLTEALRMARAMARAEPFNRILLLSDGNIPSRIDFDLPFHLEYQRVKPAGGNLGIGTVNAHRTRSGKWSLFVRLFASTDTPRTGTLALIRNGVTGPEENVVVSARNSPRLVFEVPGDAAAKIELRLTPDGFDAMACDNVAFLALAPMRRVRALVDPALPAFHHALSSIDQIDVLNKADPKSSVPLDLAVVGAGTEAPEAAVTLHVGSIPVDLEAAIKRHDASSLAVDWRRDAPLLDHVNFADLSIATGVVYLPGKQEADLENLRYEVLVYGRHGPLLLQRFEGSKQRFYLLFDSDQSTLPYRVGFPVMVSNLARIAMYAAGLLEVTGSRTHVLPRVPLLPGVTYQVHGPGGYRRQVTADRKGIAAGVPAPRVGRYALTMGGDDKANLGVSLLRPFETQLTTVDQITFTEVKVNVTAQRRLINKPLWPWLAAIAIVVLLVEWWLFHRGSKVAGTR